MSIALAPLDKKLWPQMKEEFAIPGPVWGRLWFVFGCCYGQGIISDEQWKWNCCPDISVPKSQLISKQQTRDIVARIDAAIADGSFDKDTERWGAWKEVEWVGNLGTASKRWWPTFLEFVRTLGINGFSIQG